VDWYPWGEEALSRARAENKPILLSIGYSACHWCHVMAHESFENAEIARLMNRYFVNIKVDREERPDLDSIYMAAVQALTGRGGWPLTVFLTPDGRPFYGGTYFPPDDRHGLPGFPRVLEAINASFHERPGDITKTVRQLVLVLESDSPAAPGSVPLSPDLMHRAYRGLEQDFDTRHGGFGGAPKFPQPLVLDYLLHYHHRTGDKPGLAMVEHTLDSMHRGGMYDHLGGGFHRYATDDEWQIPHFEKMLYDNALLSRVYLHAFQVTGKPEYRLVTEEILDYVLREMTDPATGGFFSSQDADSEGQEGKFYTWTADDIEGVLGQPEGESFRQDFGVSDEGNFEGGNILHLTGEFSVEASERWRGARLALRLDRERRVHPGTDTKVLVSWNGMMLAALAEASCVLRRPDYLTAAVKNADFILGSFAPDGLLRHTASVGEGFLEDYALLIDALTRLHQTSANSRWLSEAIQLTAKMVELFWDDAGNVFYDTSGATNLFKRPRTIQDGAVPSGAASAALVLLKMAGITGNERYSQVGEKALLGVAENMASFPMGFGQWLMALDFYLGPTREVAVIGDPGDVATTALLQAICRKFRPDTIVVIRSPSDMTPISQMPMLLNRPQLGGLATAYICRNFTCSPPVTEAAALEILLD
jgi:hypothetical protein